MNELQVKEQGNIKLEKDKEDFENFADDTIRKFADLISF